jgi:hypothetical protein
MKGRERPCSIRPQLRSSQNVLQRSVEPAAQFRTSTAHDVLAHLVTERIVLLEV